MLLEKTLPFYKNFRAQKPDDRGLQGEEAGQLFNLAYIESELGRPARAVEVYREALKTFDDLKKKHPNVPAYQQALAGTHNNLGLLLADLGKREEALKEYQQARDLQSQLVKDHPDLPGYQQALARTCLNRGFLLMQLNRLSDSLKDLDEGIRLSDSLRRIDLRNPDIPRFLFFGLPQRAQVLTRLGRLDDAEADWARLLKLAAPAQRTGLRVQRADGLARAGHYLRAGEAAEELGKEKTLSAGDLYNLACIQAVNATSAGRDSGRPLPVRDKRAEEYARKAVGLLERAARAGYFGAPANVAHLDKDDDLAGLRQREDYRDFRGKLKPKK